MNKGIAKDIELLQSLREVDGSAHMHFELLNTSGIVASCYVEGWTGTGGYLMRVHVAPAERNQGLATELVKAAKAAGKPALGLGVRPDNDCALRLYLKLGFVIYYKHEGKNGDFLMSLDLTGRVPAVVVEMETMLKAALGGGEVSNG